MPVQRAFRSVAVDSDGDGQHVLLRGCGPAVRRMLCKSRLLRVVEVEQAAATA